MWSSTAAAAAAATLLLALPLTVSASPSPSSSLSGGDCSSRADGFYGLGCGSEYVGCVAGHAFALNCPADLVYDESREQCEYPGNVAACGGVAPEEGSGEGSGIDGSGIDGSGEGSSVEGSGDEIEDVTGMCEERADGFYRLGACNSNFLGCSGGVAWRMACPASLKYDEEKQICDYPANVESCEEEESSGEEEGSGEGSGIDGSGIDGSGEGSGVDGSGEEIEDVTGMCEERADGFYRLGACNSSFLGCSGGVAWPMACPASLKYDEEKQICDYPGNVEGCEEGSGEVEGSGTEEGSGSEGSGTIDGSGAVVEEEEVKKETEEDVKEIEAEGDIIDESNAVVVEEEQEMKKEEVKVEEEDQEIADDAEPSPAHDDADETPSCAGRGDGFYALGCSSEMLACSNGHAHIMPCPAGLVFDEPNQICDHSVHVAACGARDQLLADDSLLTGNDDQTPAHPEIPRTRDSEVVSATLAPTTPAGPTAPAATAAVAAEYAYQTATTPRMEAGCKSSDGLFSVDCSVVFVACRGGVATKLECPAGKTFEERGQSCVPLADHPICFTHAPQKADAVIDEDVQMEKEHDDEDDLQKPIDHSFACDFVGARAEEECADWFRLCEAGRGIEMFCLQGHLFDGAAAKCVPAGQLAHCKAQ